MMEDAVSKRRRQRRRARPAAASFGSAAALLAAAFVVASPRNSLLVSAACDPCEGRSTGFVQIPGTECQQFAQCSGGSISQSFSCQGGLIYDSNLNQCNWAYSATCGPDPECTTPSPTPGPTSKAETAEPTEASETYAPTEDGGGGSAVSSPTPPVASPSPPSGTSAGGSVSVVSPVPPDSTPVLPGAPSSTPVPGLSPIRHDHHMAVWAHIAANKITISNQLLRVAQKLHNIKGSGVDADELRHYSYLDLYRSLRSMSEVGYAVPTADDQGNTLDANGQPLLARSVFYLGEPGRNDAAAVGLVNVALFLSQAMADSISSGSCDEINEEIVDGLLPASNSCGQYGMSYQDMRCPKGEEHMECAPYADMEMVANQSGRPVQPLYCGSKEKYPFTGGAGIIAGRAPAEGAAANSKGRTDVEGCCWWGRGTLPTRGVCQYGRLNYFLGSRAASEGRPARYPHVDFCQAPSSICSSQSQDSELEWVTGLFRWIDAVQSYDDGNGWNYIQKLNEFVMGGMADGLFVHSISSIVTQGCHEAPCPGVQGTAIEMDDAAERWGYFLQVLEAFGLPAKALQQR